MIRFFWKPLFQCAIVPGDPLPGEEATGITPAEKRRVYLEQ